MGEKSQGKRLGDVKLMQRAIDMACRGVQEGAGGPFGALIVSVKTQEVLSEAHNSVVKLADPTAHAEMQAIRQAAAVLKNFNLSGCEIYVTGLPCPMCMGAIFWARLDCIFYACGPESARRIGFDDAQFYEELKKRPADRSVPLIQMYPMIQKAEDCYRTWLKKIDRVSY